MNVKAILAALDKGVDFVEQILPLAKQLPVVGTYASLAETAIKAVGAIQEVVQNIEARVTEGQIVLASKDQAELKALIARLAAVNDGLNDYIVNS